MSMPSLGTCVVCGKPATSLSVGAVEGEPVESANGFKFRTWKPGEVKAYCGEHAPAEEKK